MQPILIEQCLAEELSWGEFLVRSQSPYVEFFLFLIDFFHQIATSK